MPLCYASLDAIVPVVLNYAKSHYAFKASKFEDIKHAATQAFQLILKYAQSNDNTVKTCLFAQLNTLEFTLTSTANMKLGYINELNQNSDFFNDDISVLMLREVTDYCTFEYSDDGFTLTIRLRNAHS